MRTLGPLVSAFTAPPNPRLAFQRARLSSSASSCKGFELLYAISEAKIGYLGIFIGALCSSRFVSLYMTWIHTKLIEFNVFQHTWSGRRFKIILILIMYVSVVGTLSFPSILTVDILSYLVSFSGWWQKRYSCCAQRLTPRQHGDQSLIDFTRRWMNGRCRNQSN